MEDLLKCSHITADLNRTLEVYSLLISLYLWQSEYACLSLCVCVGGDGNYTVYIYTLRQEINHGQFCVHILSSLVSTSINFTPIIMYRDSRNGFYV